jgi:DNA ligase (NAD+)
MMHDESRPNNHHPFAALKGKLGIGPVLVKSLLSFSKTEELVAAAKDLAKAVRILEQPVIMDDNSDDDVEVEADPNNAKPPWKGYRVVFTGSIANLTRSDAQEAAKQTLGAKTTPNSVSKSTDVVVYGDKGGKKLDEALSLGVQTMTAEDFMELVDQYK